MWSDTCGQIHVTRYMWAIILCQPGKNALDFIRKALHICSAFTFFGPNSDAAAPHNSCFQFSECSNKVPCNVCAFGVSQMDWLCSIGYVGVMDFIWLWQPYLFNAFRFFNNAEAAKAFNLLCVRLLEDRHHCHWPSPAGRFYHPHHRLNSGHGGTIGKYGCYLLSV